MMEVISAATYAIAVNKNMEFDLKAKLVVQSLATDILQLLQQIKTVKSKSRRSTGGKLDGVCNLKGHCILKP